MAGNSQQPVKINKQRITVPFPYLSSLFLLIIVFFFGCKQKINESAIPANQYKHEAKVLFLTSGYGSRFENFTIKEIVNRLQQDSLIHIY